MNDSGQADGNSSPSRGTGITPSDGFSAGPDLRGRRIGFDEGVSDPQETGEASPPPRKRRKGWRRILFNIGLSVGAIVAVGALALVVFICSVTRDLPSVETLQNYTPPVTTRVYAGDGTLLGEYARERRIFVPIAFVPKLVIEAFTSAEDKNFYSHPGIDPSRHHARRRSRTSSTSSSTGAWKAPRPSRSRSPRTSCSTAT